VRVGEDFPRFVSAFYGLTDKEIALVEEATK
jgi:hypothetical protein